jgi:hypothetical protein
LRTGRDFANTPYAALHTDPDLAALKGYPPFEQLLKPAS